MTICHHALTTGFSRACLVAAGAMLQALALTIVAIRVGRTGLSGPGSDPEHRRQKPANHLEER